MGLDRLDSWGYTSVAPRLPRSKRRHYMPACEVCGARLAQSKDGYAAHMKRYHATQLTIQEHLALGSNDSPIGDGSTGYRGSRIVMPIRLTNRSTERIVQDMEWELGRTIFPDTRPVKF